ncbi:MAG: nucleoside 2-deoxyribosyltransferase [Ignavibacteriales bacterium]|nr:nucleoside 2-deoxyribosyltransferase [Ignavibacteriales bacterium]
MRPDKQQLLRALRCQPTDFIPLVELGVHPKIKEALLKRPLLSLNDEVDFWQLAGYDYVKLQPKVQYAVGTIPAAIPGDRADTRNWAPEGAGLITDEATLENFSFPKSADISYTPFEKIGELLPEGMGVIGQYGDIFTMTWELMGFENFAFALYENPDLVMAINNRLGETILSMFSYFCRNDIVDAIWYSDDIAYNNGLMVSPDVLEMLFFPWLEKIGDMAKACNKPFIYHSDGDLTAVLQKIIDCGVTALHPIEPKALEITRVKEIVQNKLCLIGNFDVDILSRGTTEQIRALINETLQKMSSYTGYCAGSGNSIPDYVPLENYLAMIDEVKKFRK